MRFSLPLSKVFPKCALGDWLWRFKRRSHVRDVGLVRCFDERPGRAQCVDGDEVVGSVAARQRLTTSRGTIPEYGDGGLLMETLVVEEGVPLDVVVLQHLDERLARLGGETSQAHRRAVGGCRRREGEKLIEL